MSDSTATPIAGLDPITLRRLYRENADVEAAADRLGASGFSEDARRKMLWVLRRAGVDVPTSQGTRAVVLMHEARQISVVRDYYRVDPEAILADPEVARLAREVDVMMRAEQEGQQIEFEAQARRRIAELVDAAGGPASTLKLSTVQAAAKGERRVREEFGLDPAALAD